MATVKHSSRFDVPPAELFAFHMDLGNLARISPPFPPVSIDGASGSAAVGDRQQIWFHFGPLRYRWVAHVTAVRAPSLLEDVQEDGPFRRWRHQHRIRPDGNGSRLTDAVVFEFFPSPVGPFLDWIAVRPALALMFRWRHWRTRTLLGDPGIR
jgi:ligand-binding SRPBCC domain-containing protein